VLFGGQGPIFASYLFVTNASRASGTCCVEPAGDQCANVSVSLSKRLAALLFINSSLTKRLLNIRLPYDMTCPTLQAPTSSDSVTVTVTVDSPIAVRAVSLWYEVADRPAEQVAILPMAVADGKASMYFFKATMWRLTLKASQHASIILSDLFQGSHKPTLGRSMQGQFLSEPFVFCSPLSHI
jgi:hypothetical protein